MALPAPVLQPRPGLTEPQANRSVVTDASDYWNGWFLCGFWLIKRYSLGLDRNVGSFIRLILGLAASVCFKLSGCLIVEQHLIQIFLFNFSEIHNPTSTPTHSLYSVQRAHAKISYIERVCSRSGRSTWSCTSHVPAVTAGLFMSRWLCSKVACFFLKHFVYTPPGVSEDTTMENALRIKASVCLASHTPQFLVGA